MAVAFLAYNTRNPPYALRRDRLHAQGAHVRAVHRRAGLLAHRGRLSRRFLKIVIAPQHFVRSQEVERTGRGHAENDVNDPKRPPQSN